jgi:hypothetical protein
VGPPGLPTAAKRVAIHTQDSSAKEGHTMRRHLDRLIQALVFIRLGQQLGTDSDLAQAVAHSIDFAVSTLARFLG